MKIYEDPISKTETDLPTYDAIMADVQGGKKVSAEPSSKTQQAPIKRGRGRPRKEPTQVFVTELTSLLEKDWTNITDHADSTSAKLTTVNFSDELDPHILLARSIQNAEAVDQDHFAYVSHLDMYEPETYEKAMNSSYADQWSKAMHEEYDQLIKNKSWDLVHESDVKDGHKPLSGKWVYKIKRGVDGEITRLKVRWVVKGYLQQFGVDFDQTFASVVKPMARTQANLTWKQSKLFFDI